MWIVNQVETWDTPGLREPELIFTEAFLYPTGHVSKTKVYNFLNQV